MTQPNFQSFPTLTTQRLNLRKITPLDLNVIFRLRSESSVLKYLNMPAAKNLKAAEAYIEMISDGITKNQWILWGIEMSSNHKLIGTICLWNWDIANETAEIGFVLLPEYHKQGFISEATKSVLKFGFQSLGFQEIDGIVAPNNHPCIRVLNKFGFRKDEEFEGQDFIRFYLNKGISV